MRLFIDTNLYLRFYSSNANEYKKYLPTLIELKEYIFLPTQVVNEIERNKCSVFLQSFKTFNTSAQYTKISLPEQITDAKSVTDWNESRKTTENSLEAQKRKLEEITENILEDIADGKDQVSKEFEKLFEKATDESPEEFERARLRKDRGNPPGKRTDPIGDELCWEQILTEAESTNEMWILSDDGDYLVEYEKKYFLHPVLLRDIRKINPEIKTVHFKSLSECLDKFSASIKKLNSLPKEIDRSAIKQEESIPIFTGTTGSYQEISNPMMDLVNSHFCKTCQTLTRHYGPQYIIDNGHFEQYYACSKCGTANL